MAIMFYCGLFCNVQQMRATETVLRNLGELTDLFVVFEQELTYLQSLTKNIETNDKFYRKVAFLMYTEMVNFRPQS